MPILALVTMSLGAVWPGPPRTWRGTICTVAAAATDADADAVDDHDETRVRPAVAEVPAPAEEQATTDQTSTFKPVDFTGSDAEEASPSARGDLFSEDAPAAEEKAHSMPFYKTEQFVWTLKWTHIHLFGMNMIFIFMGVIAIFLDVGIRWKTLLVVMPFAGVLIDIATMWLKGFVSPAFFWLHIPGGALFGFSFFYVSFRSFWEMWGVRKNYASR